MKKTLWQTTVCAQLSVVESGIEYYTVRIRVHPGRKGRERRTHVCTLPSPNNNWHLPPSILSSLSILRERELFPKKVQMFIVLCCRKEATFNERSCKIIRFLICLICYLRLMPCTVRTVVLSIQITTVLIRLRNRLSILLIQFNQKVLTFNA